MNLFIKTDKSGNILDQLVSQHTKIKGYIKLPLSEEHNLGKGCRYNGKTIDPPPPPSAQELWSAVRLEVTRRLQASDSVLATLLLPDSYPTLTASQKAAKVSAWKVYRQQLRDITMQKDPANIVWPTQPK